jgi:hypothetical protein
MPAAPRFTHDQLQASLAYLDALAAKPWPRQPGCRGCTHFEPDPINPPEGMGRCTAGHGYFYPGEPHACHYRTIK